ncbi:MAG: site-2 protease family protein [Candidatus Xenobia bacterium]
MTLMYLMLSLPALLLAFSFHEMSHAWMADRLGDPTAKWAGRITLDPRPHLDPMGSAMLLLSLVMTGGHGPVFGWAKPVQFNPYNLRNPRRDGGLIALAGPASNFLLALVCGLLLRLAMMPELLGAFLYVSAMVNVGLGLFNLIPVAPLDGEKVLKALVSPQAARTMEGFERRYGAMLPMVALLLFMTVLSGPFDMLYRAVMHVMVG